LQIDNKLNKSELKRALRRMIAARCDGEALPGQRELCARFGVSTWLVNEALRGLEREGLINVRPRKGVFARKPQPGARSFLQTIFLDHPTDGRIWEYGLPALAAICARHSAECRSLHLPFDDQESLRAVFQAANRDKDCIGIVLNGTVSSETAAFLQQVEQPWVLFGDGHSPVRLERLPIVTGDIYQGARLAANLLLDKGCDALILINFFSKPEWPWVTDSRAGVLSATESRPALPVLLPETDCVAQPKTFSAEAAAWCAAHAVRRPGILCRGAYALHAATALRNALPGAPGDTPPMALLEVGISLPRLTNVEYVLCSMLDLAETCITRLDGMRRGMGAAGPVFAPFARVNYGSPIVPPREPGG